MYQNVLKFSHFKLPKIDQLYYPQYLTTKPVPVAARSKAWVCDRSLTGTVGSNLDMPVGRGVGPVPEHSRVGSQPSATLTGPFVQRKVKR